ncbi:MAG: peptidoglycan editing factor PgeF [Oscillospiraceae bacterium]|nr:peptidoglycan editing factor PgeF [Oscillospiraceae bacterium]
MSGFSQKKAGSFEWLCADIFPDCAVHAFTTRLGGVSEGHLASLNLGVSRGDCDENVEKNYSIVCSALGLDPEKLVFYHQVHGTDTPVVTSADALPIISSARGSADGSITNERGLTLAVFTADCVPVLLCDPVKNVVAAVHSGWRGTAQGIASIAVKRMERLFGCRGEDIYAAVGPCIQPCCFETDEDVPSAMLESHGELAREHIVSLGSGRFRVNLSGINRSLLEGCGLKPENISVSTECTCCSDENRYWSHRRTGDKRGSLAALIMLK